MFSGCGPWRVAQYQVRACGVAPTCTLARSWVCMYGATIHDGRIVTTSPPDATISISRSAAERQRGQAPGLGADRDRERHGRHTALVVALEQHQVDIDEIGSGDMGPAGPRVAAGDDRTELVVEETLQAHAIRLPVELVDERDVDPCVEERRDDLVVGHCLDAHLRARFALAKRSKHLGQPLVGGCALCRRRAPVDDGCRRSRARRPARRAARPGRHARPAASGDLPRWRRGGDRGDRTAGVARRSSSRIRRWLSAGWLTYRCRAAAVSVSWRASASSSSRSRTSTSIT